jgi:hypothetical protein
MCKSRRMLVALSCVLLSACATSTPPPARPSIVPTVMCHENDLDDRLPPLPVYLDGMSDFEHTRDLSDWIVQASGVYQREKARRAATAKCLADLRGAGLIN